MDTTTTITALAPGWAMAKAIVRNWQWRLRAAPPTLAENCAAVHALADSYRGTDPGFAADLDAAVARGESQAEQTGLLTPRHP